MEESVENVLNHYLQHGGFLGTKMQFCKEQKTRKICTNIFVKMFMNSCQFLAPSIA